MGGNQERTYLMLKAQWKGLVKAPMVQTNKVQFQIGMEVIDTLVDTGASISAIS